MSLPASRVFNMSSVHFVSLDKPDKVSNQYGFSFPLSDLDSEDAHVMSRYIYSPKRNSIFERLGKLVRVAAKTKPGMYGMTDSNSDLQRLHDRARIAGLTISDLIVGLPAQVHVAFYENRNPRINSRYVPMLRSVRIDPAIVPVPEFGQTLLDVRPDLLGLVEERDAQKAFKGV